MATLTREPAPAAAGRWSASRFSPRTRTIAGYSLLALLAYVPVLLSAPGRVSADTKQYLYLDPARLLSRALTLWDPNIGLGTVTHQTIGYLFPMGPYYWLLEQLAVPDWMAQRLWLGTVLFAAGTGMLYLFRTLGMRGPGNVVGALGFMLSPYTLNYSARISVILLPFAALPWMVALVARALRDGGWRYPAIFAVVVQIVGGVNATALVFAGLGPVLWVPYAVWITREVTPRRAVTTVAKMGLLVIGTSLWWMAGLWAQGSYGLNILRFTETVETVTRDSLASETFRGLGYWFFYGTDKLDPWINASIDYTQRPPIIFLSYLVPALALLSAGLVRWRHRAYFVLVALVGVVIAVGAHPYDDPSPLGGVFKALADRSTVALALRSTGRAVPLVVLGMAGLLAAGVNALVRYLALRERRREGLVAAGVVGAVVVLALPALWNGDFYGASLQRPEDVPEYWTEAIAEVDAGPHDTRILELPGADFASYQWGNTVDPLTPGLTDRPYVARELVPWGSPASADLVNALDRRIQEGILEPEALVPIARLMSVGDVVARNDIQNDRYNVIRPRSLWRLLTEPATELEDVREFGGPLVADNEFPLQDEQALAFPANEETPPTVAVLSVPDTTPIVRATPAAEPLIVSGDGEGLVDVAAVGLIEPDHVVLYSASFSDADALRAQIDRDASLVVTDTNRQRARRWTTVRDNIGYTEQAGEEALVDDPSDERLDVFPDAPESAFTVVDQQGVSTVRASHYGNPVSYTPEDRADRAIDGDTSTAWRVGAFDNVDGEYIRVDLTDPMTTDQVNLVQPLEGPRDRFITRATISFDGGDEITVDLDDTSRTAEGQTIAFDERTFSTFELRVDETNVGNRFDYKGLSGVGLAEIRLRDDASGSQPVVVDEVVVMPTDLVDAAESSSADNPLSYVMTRERLVPVPPRSVDPEQYLAREFEVPTTRDFELSGTARINPSAESETIDIVLGYPRAAEGGITARATDSMPGDVQSRATSAIDGDLATAWRTPFGAVTAQAVEYELAEPVTFDHLDLELVTDGRHSVPTKITVQVGDDFRRGIEIPPLEDHESENATSSVRVEFPELEGDTVRVTVDEVRAVETLEYFGEEDIEMPVGIAEVGIPGVQAVASSDEVDTGCRRNLLTVDDRPVGVQIVGSLDAAESREALEIVPCRAAAAGLPLDDGTHELRTEAGTATAIDFDRVVLSSPVAGGVTTAAVGTGDDGAGPTVEVDHEDRTSLRVRVEDADEPFWLVLGQSYNEGWAADAAGTDLGAPQLVDGYANGWLIEPGADGVPTGSFDVTVEWEPAKVINFALALSGAALALCAVLIGVTTWRRRRARRGPPSPPPAAFLEPELVSPLETDGLRPSRTTLVVAPLLAALAGAILVAPWAGLLLGAAVLTVLLQPRTRVVMRLFPAAALFASGCAIAIEQIFREIPPTFDWPTAYEAFHTVAWLAILFLAADMLVELATRPSRAPNPDTDLPPG